MKKNVLNKNAFFACAIVAIMMGATFSITVNVSTVKALSRQNPSNECISPDDQIVQVTCQFVDANGGIREIVKDIPIKKALSILQLLERSALAVKNGNSEMRTIVKEVLLELDAVGLLPVDMNQEFTSTVINRLEAAKGENEFNLLDPVFFHLNIGSLVLGAGFGRETFTTAYHLLPILPFILPMLISLPLFYLIPRIVLLSYLVSAMIIGSIASLMEKFPFNMLLCRPKFLFPIGLWQTPRGMISTFGLLGPRFHVNLLNGVSVFLFGFVGLCLSIPKIGGGIIGFAPLTYIDDRVQ